MEAYSSTLCFEIKKMVSKRWGMLYSIYMYINDYSRVKPENIMKLNTICMMDWAFTKPSAVRPRFLPYHACPTIVH